MNEFTNQNESTGTTRTHNVAHGESLWSIAKNDLLSQTDRVTNKDIALEVLKIERENNFRNPDRIKVNDQMFLPSLYLSDSGKGGLSDAPSPPLSAAFIHSVLRSVQEPTSTPASDAPAPDSSAATLHLNRVVYHQYLLHLMYRFPRLHLQPMIRCLPLP